MNRADKRRILSEQRNELKEIAALFAQSAGFGRTAMDLIESPDDRKFITEVVLPLCSTTGKEQRQRLEEYSQTGMQRTKRIIREIKDKSENSSTLLDKALEESRKPA